MRGEALIYLRWLYVLSAPLTWVGVVNQICKVWHGDVAGVSLALWATDMVGALIWFLYGCSIRNLSLLGTQAIAAILRGSVVVGLIWAMVRR